MLSLSCWKLVFEALRVARKIALMAAIQAQDTSSSDVMGYWAWLEEVFCLCLAQEESSTPEDFTEWLYRFDRDGPHHPPAKTE